MTETSLQTLEYRTQQEIDSYLSNTAKAILELAPNCPIPEDNQKARIDSFFQTADSTTNGMYVTYAFGKYVRSLYETYANDLNPPAINCAAAAWVALGAEDHDSFMSLAFKHCVTEAAQTPANKKALAAWFAHERAKGNGLCADRKTAIQATAKALGLDLK